MSKKCLTYNGNHEEATSDTPSTALPYSSYDSIYNTSPQTSQSHDTDSISDNSKKIRKKRCTYQKIEDEARIKLIEAVQEGETLKAAAKRYNINYSSAKSILHTYRTEGRIFKKSAQERVARKRSKGSSNLEMSPIYPYHNSEENFTGVPDFSTYQTYHSPEPESPKAYNLVNNDIQRTAVRAPAMDNYRDISTVNLQNQQTIDNNANGNLPSSTVVFKLGSHGLQKIPSNNMRSAQPNRNWQFNVNVQKENITTEAGSIPNEGPYQGATNPLQRQEKLRSYEGYYVDHQASPAPYNPQIRREEPHYDKYYNQGYNNYPSVMGYPEENDISCYLNSTPAYDKVYERAPQEGEQMVMSGNPMAINNSRRVSESYNHYYDEANRVHSMENYRL